MFGLKLDEVKNFVEAFFEEKKDSMFTSCFTVFREQIDKTSKSAEEKIAALTSRLEGSQRSANIKTQEALQAAAGATSAVKEVVRVFEKIDTSRAAVLKEFGSISSKNAEANESLALAVKELGTTITGLSKKQEEHNLALRTQLQGLGKILVEFVNSLTVEDPEETGEEVEIVLPATPQKPPARKKAKKPSTR